MSGSGSASSTASGDSSPKGSTDLGYLGSTIVDHRVPALTPCLPAASPKSVETKQWLVQDVYSTIGDTSEEKQYVEEELVFREPPLKRNKSNIKLPTRRSLAFGDHSYVEVDIQRSKSKADVTSSPAMNGLSILSNAMSNAVAAAVALNQLA